jgi:hypothetical protein
MTPKERKYFASRLVAMQQTLRTVFEACEAQAAICEEAGANRLAFAVHMVRESLIGYSKELNVYVLRVMSDDDLEDEDEGFPLDY